MPHLLLSDFVMYSLVMFPGFPYLAFPMVILSVTVPHVPIIPRVSCAPDPKAVALDESHAVWPPGLAIFTYVVYSPLIVPPALDRLTPYVSWSVRIPQLLLLAVVVYLPVISLLARPRIDWPIVMDCVTTPQASIVPFPPDFA